MTDSDDRPVSVYELLGRLFLEPVDDGLYGAVTDESLWSASFGQVDNTLVQRGIVDMRAACEVLRDLDDGEGDGRTALATEFTAWFVGPERQLVPPWESLYQGDGRHLFGSPAEQVRAFMRSVGLHNERFGQYPEDHLGFELLVLAALGQREAPSDAERAEIADFVRVHPLALSHTMQERARECGGSGSGFYLALLEIAEGVLEEDEKELAA